MSDSENPPSLESIWAQYDAIQVVNPSVAARFALEHRLFDSPRPAATPDGRDGRVRVEAIRASNPNPTPEQIAARLAWSRR